MSGESLNTIGFTGHLNSKQFLRLLVLWKNALAFQKLKDSLVGKFSIMRFYWSTNEKSLFRYAGITMEVCMSDYRCCWDGTTSPLNCFHPQGRKTDGGMSIAGAVFLSIFIWGTILLIVVLFFMKKKGTTLPCNFL